MKRQNIFIMLLVAMSIIFNLVNASYAYVLDNTIIEVGDYIYLGSYDGEPILWRCVMIREDGPLMLSDKVIAYKAFDAASIKGIPEDPNDATMIRNYYGSNEYKTSSIRKWLNSTGSISWEQNKPSAEYVTANPYDMEIGFISNFSAQELSMVKKVTNKNVICSIDKADAGETEHEYSLDWRIVNMVQNYDTAFIQYTEDFFFLLNTLEVVEMCQSISNTYLVAHPTEHAKLHCETKYLDNVYATYWWLRDAYADYKFPEGVRCMYPGAHEYFENANNGNIGVRPAFVANDVVFPCGKGTLEEPYTLTKNNEPNNMMTIPIISQEQEKEKYIGSIGVATSNGKLCNISIGDYVEMGVMDNEPILWRCVDIDDNGPLLLSDKLIRFYSFDAAGEREGNTDATRVQYGSNRWSTCTLRHWLNSYYKSWGNWEGVQVPSAKNMYYEYSPYDKVPGFMTSFSNEECSMMVEADNDSLLNAIDIYYATSGIEVNKMRRKITLLDNYESAFKEKTVDTVFLISRAQANHVYSLFGNYIVATPTIGAVQQSGYKTFAISEGKTWHYWLRDALGDIQYPYYTMDITTDGRVSADFAYSAQYGVRPAFYLNMETCMFDSGNGTKLSAYRVQRHRFDKVVVVTEPQCEVDGLGQRICSLCGEIEEYKLDRLGHDFKTSITRASLFFHEKIIKTCTICGYKYTLGGQATIVLASVFTSVFIIMFLIVIGKIIKK